MFLVTLTRHFVKYPELRHSQWRIAELTGNPFSKHLLRSWRYQGERHNPCSQRPYNSNREAGQPASELSTDGELGTVIDPGVQAERESAQMKRRGVEGPCKE